MFFFYVFAQTSEPDSWPILKVALSFVRHILVYELTHASQKKSLLTLVKNMFGKIFVQVQSNRPKILFLIWIDLYTKMFRIKFKVSFKTN